MRIEMAGLAERLGLSACLISTREALQVMWRPGHSVIAEFCDRITLDNWAVGGSFV